MNRVFKVVWNDVRGAYMVCDESRMSHGKAKNVKNAVVLAAVVAILGMTGVGNVAMATEIPDVNVTGETFENINKTVEGSFPLAAAVSVTASEATSLTVTNSDFRNNTITVKNASGTPTAVGIASHGVDVSVANSHFTNNASTDQGDVNGAYGSALGVSEANLTVRGSDFTGNTATSERQTQGSAIYHKTGHISVSDSTFANNTGANVAEESGAGNSTGGAVSLWGVGGNIDNSIFIGNKTAVADGDNISYGGALYVRSGIWGGEKDLKLTVSNSVFNNNEAQGGNAALGGAIYVKSDPETTPGNPNLLALDVNKSIFDGNKADENGGAIYSLNAPLSVNGSEFYRNEAMRGGAIYSKEGTVAIANSTFSGNVAKNRGAALYLENNGKKKDIAVSSISGSVFDANKVVDPVKDDGFGGAVGVAYMNLNIDNSTFKNNEIVTAAGESAGAGGAMFVMTRSNSPTNESLTTVNVSNSRFEANKAASGGAIANYDALSVKNSSFVNNTAQNDMAEGGGALFLGSVTTTSVAQSSFSGNVSATGSGGAIDTRNTGLGNNSAARLDIVDSTFTSNQAKTDGGAISNTFYASNANAGAVSIIRSRFDKNIATGNGGAIYNDGSGDRAGNHAAIAIADTSFTNNSAGSDGGAIYNSADASLTLSGVNTFSGNTAGTGNAGSKNDIHNLGTITIAGGVTTLDGGISGDSGIVNLNGGALNATAVNKGFGTVNVAAGTLNTGTIAAGSKINLSDTGVLKTTSNQVMKEGLNAEGTNAETGGTRTEAGVTYQGGTLALTDSKYNLDYVRDVSASLMPPKRDASPSALTRVEMTGTLVDSAGQKVSEVKVSDLPATGVVLTEVKGNTEGKSLVIGDGAGGDGKIAVDGNLGVGALNMGDATDIQITGGQSLTLAGNGGQLVQSTDNTGTQQAVAVSLDTKGSALNLGSAATGKDGQLTGTITATADTVVNIAGGTQTVKGDGTDSAAISTAGTVNVASGAALNTTKMEVTGNTGVVNVSGGASLQADKLSIVAGDNKLAVAGTAAVSELTAAAGNTITVGDSTSKGTLNIAKADLNGAVLFLDPGWVEGKGIEGASEVTANFANNTINGKLAVGQNSMLVLGDDNVAWARAEFEKTGKTWAENGITAALAIRAPVTLHGTEGGIVVDGSMQQAPVTDQITANKAVFAANSMLIVDAARLGDQAAITGASGNTGTATVDAKAALHVANAKVGSTTTVLDGFASNGITITDGGWSGDNLTSTDAMIGKLSMTNSDGKVTVDATGNLAQDAFPGIMPYNTMNRIWAADGTSVNGDGIGVNDTNSSNAGIAFLSRATDESYLAHSDAARTVNGASLIAIAAGVQNSTIGASDSINQALHDHLSLASNVSQAGAPALHKEGADLWASLLYKNSKSGDIHAGAFNANTKNDFGGIMVGSDYTWKRGENSQVRAGAALSFGKGEGKSEGDFNYTKNDYNTYGINLYGGWNTRNTNLVADVGYMKGDNELKQNMAANMGGNLKADIDTSVWTIGVRGEHRFNTDVADIMPHAGVRYLNVKTKGFDTKNDAGVVFKTDSDTMNLWQFPIGVTLSKNFLSSNGWTVKPKVDISFIPTAGDKDATTQVSVPGVGTGDTLVTEIMDSTSWVGTLGLDVQKGNTSLGLRVGYQKSSDSNSRGAMLTVGHQFE